MTDTSKPSLKDKAPGGIFAVAILVGAIATVLSPSEGGRRLDVYRDSAGILTACMGVIGPVVNVRGMGGKFTDAECDHMEKAYLTKMVTMMQACVSQPVQSQMTYGEWIWLGHWAYNTGTAAFCHSTLAKRLAAGDHVGACRAMGSWTFITLPGGKHVNCRDPANRCLGIPKRRDIEVNMCLESLP